MKKILILTIITLMSGICAFADSISEVRTFFDNYVKDANSYSKNIPNYYASNAKIIRVVHKKDGTRKSVVFPMSAYLDQMQKGSGLAKTVRYHNNYSNIKVSKVGNNYKITALRTPMNDKIGLPFHFIVSKTQNGYKVIEESMDTTVQSFLKYAK